MLLLMLPKVFSLLYKDFMLPFEIIRCLKFHTCTCVSVFFMLLLMLPKLFSLLDKGFMLLFWSIRLLRFHTCNCVTLFFMLILILPNVFSFVHTIFYTIRNRVVLYFILWIIWLYSSTIKTFKCIVIISCWSRS